MSKSAGAPGKLGSVLLKTVWNVSDTSSNSTLVTNPLPHVSRMVTPVAVTCPSPPAHRMLFFSCTFWLDPVTSTAFAASSITVLFVSASVPPDVSTLSTQIPRVPLSYTRLLATVFVPKNIVRWIPVPLSYTVLPSTTTFPDPTPTPSPLLPYTRESPRVPPPIPTPLVFPPPPTPCTTTPN